MIQNSVVLANMALRKFGAKRIISFDDTTTESGKAINESYYPILELVLSVHPWNFAQKEVALTALTVTPVVTERNMPYVYQRPSDLVSINYKTKGANVSVQADGIHSDTANLQIIYTYLNLNPLTYPMPFAMAFATRLAHEMCFSFTESSVKPEKLLEQYEKLELPQAIFHDRMQGSIIQINQEDYETFRNFGSGNDVPEADIA
jgi:hypothetical protein